MRNNSPSVINISSREAVLKRKIRRHLRSIGFSKSRNGELKIGGEGKEIVRALHRAQRESRITDNKEFLATRAPRLLHHFANGVDVEPSKISPVIERISAGTRHGDLFRLASLTWSVPVGLPCLGGPTFMLEPAGLFNSVHAASP